MTEIICGKHQYNGVLIGEPCPMCKVEEEQGRTDKDLIDRLTTELDRWREREATICPEDFGFEEVIAALEKDKARVDRLENFGVVSAGFEENGVCLRWDDRDGVSLRAAIDAKDGE